ncbi:MAG TPA: hypothetical protein VK983_03685 [Candidatus Limnocylindrales bacterium]|nr:hypothetical protein [Candidatus Limnocylindrales bacterium]
MIHTLYSLFSVTNGCRPPGFFGLKPWYQYLKTEKDCTVRDFQVLGGTSGSDFLLIGLALVDDLLRIAGFVAIGYVIYGGILYITSQGSPEQTGKAQNTIQNALVGLVITVVAVAFVGFLGARLGDA